MNKINVNGMTCQNCVRHVKEALENINGLTDVNVNLDENSATFNKSENINMEDVIKAVKDAGYQASL